MSKPISAVAMVVAFGVVGMYGGRTVRGDGDCFNEVPDPQSSCDGAQVTRQICNYDGCSGPVVKLKQPGDGFGWKCTSLPKSGKNCVKFAIPPFWDTFLCAEYYYCVLDKSGNNCQPVRNQNLDTYSTSYQSALCDDDQN